MSKAFKEATDLPPHQRLALAELLTENTDPKVEPDAEPAWDAEIRDRIRRIDEGQVTGISYQDVLQEAEKRLAP